MSDTPGTELALDEQMLPASPLQSQSPEQAAQMVLRVAKAIGSLLRGGDGLIVSIQGKDHITASGWQVAAGLVGGVSTDVLYSRPVDYIDDNDGVPAFEARVTVTTADGLAATVDAIADPHEHGAIWSKTAHGVRAMAQTRAESRALRSVLARYVRLAGFEATIPEEVGAQGPVGADPAEVSRGAYTAIQNATSAELVKAIAEQMDDPAVGFADPVILCASTWAVAKDKYAKEGGAAGGGDEQVMRRLALDLGRDIEIAIEQLEDGTQTKAQVATSLKQSLAKVALDVLPEQNDDTAAG